MKRILLVLSFLFLSYLAPDLYSQVEIKHNEYTKGLLNGDDLFKFTAKNTGKDNLNIVYSVSVVYNDTLLYESSTKSLPLASGESANIDFKFTQPPLTNWLSNRLKGMIIREGDFLIGDYKICIMANPANSKNLPDKDKVLGSECLNHTVANYENDAVMEIKPKKPEEGKLSLTDLWNFTTVNKSKSKQIVEVYCTLTFNGETMLEAYSRPFSVQPGENAERNFKLSEAVWTRFKMEQMRDKILQSGIFPPGKYNLCLSVRSEWSHKEFGSGCIDAVVEEEKKDK